MENTMAMNIALRIHANVAAGGAFQTHHVVATFQMQKARNESQNILPRSPCAMRPSINRSGTKPMNTKGAMPHVGHAAVSKPPARTAKMVRNPFPFRVSCLLPPFKGGRGDTFFFFPFISNLKNSGKGTIFCL